MVFGLVSGDEAEHVGRAAGVTDQLQELLLDLLEKVLT